MVEGEPVAEYDDSAYYRDAVEHAQGSSAQGSSARHQGELADADAFMPHTAGPHTRPKDTSAPGYQTYAPTAYAVKATNDAWSATQTPSTLPNPSAERTALLSRTAYAVAHYQASAHRQVRPDFNGAASLNNLYPPAQRTAVTLTGYGQDPGRAGVGRGTTAANLGLLVPALPYQTTRHFAAVDRHHVGSTSASSATPTSTGVATGTSAGVRLMTSSGYPTMLGHHSTTNLGAPPPLPHTTPLGASHMGHMTATSSHQLAATGTSYAPTRVPGNIIPNSTSSYRAPGVMYSGVNINTDSSNQFNLARGSRMEASRQSALRKFWSSPQKNPPNSPQRASSLDDFQCACCDKAFPSLQLLEQHMGTHATGLHQCNLCDTTFAHHDGLRQHYDAEHTNMGRFTCLYCDRNFFSALDCVHHSQQVHHSQGGYVTLSQSAGNSSKKASSGLVSVPRLDAIGKEQLASAGSFGSVFAKKTAKITTAAGTAVTTTAPSGQHVANAARYYSGFISMPAANTAATTPSRTGTRHVPQPSDGLSAGPDIPRISDGLAAGPGIDGSVLTPNHSGLSVARLPRSRRRCSNDKYKSVASKSQHSPSSK